MTLGDFEYYIDIIETKPASAITIIETDCEVDFAPPLDYREPERGPAIPPPAASTTASQDESKETEEAKFSPFTGVGRRLDGKPLKYSVAPITTGIPDAASQPTNTKSTGPSSSSSTPQRRSSGKLVFGSGTGPAPAGAPKEAAKEVNEEVPKEEPKFQAFTGKKYSLKD